MKTFKTLHSVNKFFFLMTLFLYITVYLGMLFQMVLGAVQIVLAIIISNNYKQLEQSSRKRIVLYWIFVMIDTVLIVLNNQYGNDLGNGITLLLIPMLIAGYFYYVTANLNSDSFLNAQWNNLALFNYEIDAEVLKPLLPTGTEIDYWNGKCYVSLVGFMFEEVKVKGMKIPLHTNFEEVNLRFYVKRMENGEWKRGVVFIREMVPKRALAFVANLMYKEHYETLKMKHSVTENPNSIDFVYQWEKNKRWNTLLVETEKNTVPIEVDTEAEFITEHYFGYTKVDEFSTFEYEVKHPRWDQYKVTDYRVDVDFEATYGSTFAFLKHQEPTSIMLAKGSEISVENKKKIV